jgi:diacylglycerol kinase family enzyme
MPTCFLVNPNAGGGAAARFVPVLERSVGEVCEEPLVRVLGSERDVEEVCARPETARVIVVGGDGTFSGILPFAVRSRALFGILPVGTGNDLARELGVFRAVRRRNLIRAVDVLLGGAEESLDVWELSGAASQGRLFCNYVSLGLDARVVALFEQMRRRLPAVKGLAGVLRNRVLYLVAAAREGRYGLPEGVRITNGDTGRETEVPHGCRNVLFANVASYMGLGVSSRWASPFDGVLPCLTASSGAGYAAALWRRTTGSMGRQPEQASSWSVALGDGRVPIQCDGEYLGCDWSGDLRIRRAGGVRVLVGPRIARG